MDAAQALAELTELSSQVERAVVLDAGGATIASTDGDDAGAHALAQAARDAIASATELHSSGGAVTTVEIELAGGALFVVSDGALTVAATTGSEPTAGLVAYDLRTCLARIGAGEPEKPKRRRNVRKPKEETG